MMKNSSWVLFKVMLSKVWMFVSWFLSLKIKFFFNTQNRIERKERERTNSFEIPYKENIFIIHF